MVDYKNNSAQKHFAAIIRHGERSKHIRKFDYSNKVDPPLTGLGIRQSQATAEFLKWYFKENNYIFDKVIVECSPALTCMMTAGEIASALGCKEVIINYRASEIIHPKLGPNPTSKLEWVKYGFSFEKMQAENPLYQGGEFFPEGVHFRETVDYKDYMFEAKEETKEQGQARGL